MKFYVVGVYSKKTNILELFETEAKTELNAIKNILFNIYNTSIDNPIYTVSVIHI